MVLAIVSHVYAGRRDVMLVLTGRPAIAYQGLVYALRTQQIGHGRALGYQTGIRSQGSPQPSFA
jgi:hypothetical protein